MSVCKICGFCVSHDVWNQNLSYGFPVLNLFALIAIAFDTVCSQTVEVPIIF